MSSEDELRADFRVMRAAGTRIGQTASDVSETFDREHSELDAALGGWAGASKAALSAVTGQWRATADTLVTAVNDHARGIHDAANRFENEEMKNAERLRRITSGDDDQPPLLNLD
ncbi:WXG100 family type VII secretion target [Gordonia sp. PKS22-38]|uniref:WXG100 family type VII secretion target n=1 Tax=Gordonia prachuapensis TaxID=3115651 RepID=A0ABU7MUY3_9ACTN|nr:WXG100 family type VII secretion target [Gordonia sp. PKS22-38]